MQPSPQTPGQRMADGAAQLVSSIAADVYATFANVVYGSGQAVLPPYATRDNSNTLQTGLNDLVGGGLDAMRHQLTRGADDLRNELTGQQQQQQSQGLSH